MSARHISHLTASALLTALLAAGCGGAEQPASATPDASPATATPAPTATSTEPQAHAKDAPEPPPDSASPSPDATASPTTAGEQGEGGGGDEREARVPVALTVQPDGQVVPATVSVPAFLALELVVRNRTGAPLAVTLEGATPGGPLEVASGATARRRIEGLRDGRYAVRAAGAGSATVIVGVEPGP
jgi:beta-N-acetylhexosaminidase